MQEVVMIMSIILPVLMAAKKTKKPVFGQLTLTGDLALDWMKDGMEIIVGKVMIGPMGAFPEYNVPEWANERTGDIGVIYHANSYANPVLVTQRSILRALEIWCVDQEAKGAETLVEKKGSGQRGVLIIKENNPNLTFTRGDDPGKYDPYKLVEK
jgi:hypothetical protein